MYALGENHTCFSHGKQTLFNSMALQNRIDYLTVVVRGSILTD